MIGKTFSHYEVLEEIGRGGMGVVYRARDVKLNRDVALKVLRPELVTDEARKRRFVQEAQAAAALKHPNIAVVYEIDDVDDVTFIGMELIEGAKLSDVLARKHLPLSRALELAIEVTDALSRAHEKGIVHRDLKPANVMVTEDGHPKIIDFGLAKLVEPAGEGESELETAVKGDTRDGQVLGTLAYMSPEQAKGQTVDHRTDIFSFGIVLYEMLTGELPFKAESAAEMPHAIIHQPPTPLGDRVSGATAPELQRIVNKCIAKDREERYQTAKDLFIDLRGVKRDSESKPSEVLEVATPSVGARASRRWLLPAGVAFLLLLAIAGIFLLRGPSESPLPQIGRTIQLTREPGLETHPAISPDGSMVAYAAGPSMGMKIYVQQISGGRAIPLTEDLPGVHGLPHWSPDGSQITFSSRESGRNELYAIPSLGGAPRPLLDIPSEIDGYGSVWSPDGKRLAYTDWSAVFVKSLDESGARKIVNAANASPLSWSPDGTHIAYASGGFLYVFVMNLNPSSVWVVPVSGGDPVRVTENAFLDYNPIWSLGGKHLFFISNRGGGTDIYGVPIQSSGAPTGPPVRLTTGLDVHTMSLSNRGRRLAYSVLESKQNIWSIPIPDAGPVSIEEARPVTTGNQMIEGVDVSPDGEWLVFDSSRSGNQDIYKVPLEGGEPIQITTDAADDSLPVWSPDGKEIAFYSWRTGNRDIFVMSADGQSLRQMTHDEAIDYVPDWSPDGTQLVFASDRTGRDEIYVISAKEGEPAGEMPRQLTRDGGTFPRWSPSSGWIAFCDDDSVDIVSEDGSETRYIAENADVSWVGWSSDGQTVYYRAFGPERGTSFWSVPVSGGEPTLLVRRFDPGVWHPLFFTSGAGRLFFTLSEHESDIWVMELEQD